MCAVVCAPLVVVPSSAAEKSALVANLGTVKAGNRFLWAEETLHVASALLPGDEGTYMYVRTYAEYKIALGYLNWSAILFMSTA